MKKSNGFLINEESRQHINLSIKANSVIESDMVRFNDDYDLSNKSGFLNKILSNYYNSFPLSMVVALKQLNVIRKAIKSDAVSDRITSKIIDEFSYETMKNSISEYAKRYKYDIQLKLKLNKENAAILSSLEEAKYFEEHAPRSGVGFYLKSIFESYVTLSREKREKIYFKDLIEQINTSISNRTLLVIKDKGQVTKLLPWYIDKPTDKSSLELFYIIPNEDVSIENLLGIPGSIKIKDLKKRHVVFLKTRTSGILSELGPLRIGNGSGFGSESRLEKEKFIVEFTEGGLKRFIFEEDALPIIGIPDQDNEYRYTFNTTEPQIFMHLFKFGLQAQIISPTAVREKFKRLYKASFEEYEQRDSSK
jgi:hypothetical protein